MSKTIRKDTPILAWHFVGKTLRDGRPIPPDGEWLVHRGRVVPCKSGLHASERLIDTLKYAPGSTLCRVECAGTVKREADKIVCSRRRIVWRMDASNVLHDFARRCALDVAHLWEMPSVVRTYLETGDETLRAAAWSAAWMAKIASAYDAADAAACAASRAAAHDAAHDAARGAARAAAYEAASAAEYDAALDAARNAQNERLVAMIEAARSSSGSAV